MTFEIKNLQNILKVIYFITQRPISNICWDIVLLGLLLGSVDPQTCVLEALGSGGHNISTDIMTYQLIIKLGAVYFLNV